MTKKITFSLAFICLTAVSVFAQKNARLVPIIDESVDAAPINHNQKYISGPNQVQNLFDVQFNYNATDTVGRNGMAGVVYTGTEFWVSRWATDTIYSFSPTGSVTDTFKIPTLTGVRAFTWDGTFIYAGVNTTSIKVINPVTKTVVSTITNGAGSSVRHITYDSTANGGAGGFWVGNFNTDIVQISMTGTVLQTINAATHGLTGMYGSAIDHWTLGGPYLWIYDQGGAATSRLVRLQLPSGVSTGLTHETMPDIGIALTSGLAGGLFITNQLNATERTIVGVIQGTPDNMLFGYELNDFVLAAVDARLDSLKPSSPYLMRPLTHYTTPLTWLGEVSNQGANTLTSTDFIVDVKNGVTPVFTNTTTVSNLASMAIANQTTSAGLSGSTTATFNVVAYAEVNAPQADLANLNDTIKYSYMVTDTVFAREMGVTNGALGIGGGTGGTLGQRFTTTVPDEVRSITFRLNNPMLGDSVRAQLYAFGTAPTTILASTGWHKITVPDTLGVTLTMPIIGGPYSIAAGNYFVGVQEVMENITLATTTSNFNAGSSWVIFGANPWATSESYGFPRTYFIRMNVSGPAVGIHSYNSSNDGLLVYPNPANTTIAVNIGEMSSANTTISILNVLGETVYSARVNNTKTLNLDLSDYTSGVYFVKLDNGSSSKTTKFIIKK